MSKSKLPDNAAIELIDRDYDEDRQPFRIRFDAVRKDLGDYHSEAYHPEKGETVEQAALRICERCDWIERPPATGILTVRQLQNLGELVDDAIHDMERNPARYCPDPDAVWRELFDWNESKEFFQEMMPTGDPPVPSYESGWTAYLYDLEIGRVRVGRNGGIEVVTFHSGDMDGNWEVEAEFVRHKPGTRVAAADKERLKKAYDAKQEAWRRMDKCRRGSKRYDAAQKAYWRRCEKLRCLALLRNDEECWDPEEFQYYMAMHGCYWTLLRYKRYEIACAITGEDPLDNVMAERAEVAAVYDVITPAEGKIRARKVGGDSCLRREALSYQGGHTHAEMLGILKEFPEGRPIERSCMGIRTGWKPVRADDREVVIRVEMKGSKTLPITKRRVREVSCRGLEEDVKRMLVQIDRLYPANAT